MFRNIPEMYQHIERLQKAHSQIIQEKKEQLNFKCEACQINPIEIDYKCNEYSKEQYTENGSKLTINAHFFCKNCYIHVIKTNQLEKSQWMGEIDKELFED